MSNAGMAMSMVTAYIQVLPPGFGTVVFSYNPDEFTTRRTANWHSTPQPVLAGGPTPQYQGNTARKLDLKILLDTFAVPPSPPEITIRILQAAMEPTVASMVPGMSPKPPSVMFGWGANIVMLEAYITALAVTHKRVMFGRPLRSEVTVSLEEVPSLIPSMLAGTNPTSGGLATQRTHLVVEGDTLASVAYAVYGDATKWRALAEANGIDDAMRVAPGTLLLVPDAGEAESLA